MEVKVSITSFFSFLIAERCSHRSGKKLPNALHLKFQSQTDVNQILWLQKPQEIFQPKRRMLKIGYTERFLYFQCDMIKQKFKWTVEEQQKIGDGLLCCIVRYLPVRRHSEFLGLWDSSICTFQRQGQSAQFTSQGTDTGNARDIKGSQFCLHCGSLIPWQDCFQTATAVQCYWCYKTGCMTLDRCLALVELKFPAGKEFLP